VEIKHQKKATGSNGMRKKIDERDGVKECVFSV